VRKPYFLAAVATLVVMMMGHRGVRFDETGQNIEAAT
jgi:hypothetical protein